MKDFAVASRTPLSNGNDLWESNPISYNEAMLILKYNGWPEEQAKADLKRCPDEYILVNSNTQIC